MQYRQSSVERSMKRPAEIPEGCVQRTAECSAPLDGGTPVLPGEDPAEFRELLQDLYAVHRPRTRNEARCVDAVADYEWCLQRSRQMRRHYHAKLITLHAGTPDAEGGVHCERDPHRWHHSAMDCSLEANRLCRLQEQELRKLAQLKKQRLRNLAADAAEAAGDAEVIVPRHTLPTRPAPSAAVPPQPAGTTPVGTGNGKGQEAGSSERSGSGPPSAAVGRNGPDGSRRFPLSTSGFTEIAGVSSG
jgi:hypothetical protein